LSILFGADKPDLNELFDTVETIAVIGCSSNPYRTSNHITKYLIDQGFTVIPINPNETEVFGLKSYPSIDDIPEEVKVDVMNIFRNKKYTDETVIEIIEWADRREQKPIIWTQLDVSTDSAKKKAKDRDLTYVENRCIMVDHRSI